MSLLQKIPSINSTISKPSEVLGGDSKRIFPCFQIEEGLNTRIEGKKKKKTNPLLDECTKPSCVSNCSKLK